jgi:hypothetical protein
VICIGEFSGTQEFLEAHGHVFNIGDTIFVGFNTGLGRYGRCWQLVVVTEVCPPKLFVFTISCLLTPFGIVPPVETCRS